MENYNLQEQFPKEPETIHQTVLTTLRQLGEGKEEKANISGRKKILFPKKWAVAAAVLVLLLGGTVLAAELFQWDRYAVEEFGEPSRELQDKLTANGAAAAQEGTAASDGITVTALQTVQDEQRIYILLKVTSEEEIIGGPGFTEWSLQDENGESVLRSTLSYSFENGAEEETLTKEGYLTLTIGSLEQDWHFKQLTVCLSGYCYSTYEEGKKVSHTIDGCWEIPVVINNTDTAALTKHYETGQEVILGDIPMTVREIKLTPLTVEISLDSSEEKTCTISSIPLVYGMESKDGSVTENNGNISCSGSFYSPKEGEWKYNMEFSTVMDVENAAAILLEENGELVRIELQE